MFSLALTFRFFTITRLFALLALVVLATACHTMPRLVRKNQEVHIATVNNNVCKRLEGKVVLYAIFVDSRHTNPWSTYDITSTLDSIRLGMDWLEAEAREIGVPLDITLDYHQTAKEVAPIAVNLPRKTLYNSLLVPNGVRGLDRWADKIGRAALQTFGPDTASITKTKIKPKDRERLLARLRDKHKTDNVALVYFINNYYSDEISLALHTGQDDTPEYAIVSYKQPSVIVHEFLHLFGALDLYVSPWDSKRKAQRRKAMAMKEFPNEIMAFAHRNLDDLEISSLTQYLIGWQPAMKEEHQRLIAGKRYRFAKY